MNDKKVILKADDLVKKFGGLNAVDHVSIHLFENEILGLIGANGAGKTTTFNLISGTLPMTSGSLWVNGKKLKKNTSYQMAKLGIGRTFQVVQPFSNLTVLENTMVGAFLRTNNSIEAREKSEKILIQLDLAHKADVNGKELSLLDLKRMEIARALATQPAILLLDEVMAGLDPSDSAKVMNMIRAIRDSGVSIILVEHVMKAVMGLCDRIYVLNQGHLIAEGKPEEIAKNPMVIESYLGGKAHAQSE